MMLTAADARRRWFGALFLALAAGLLIWGQTLLKPHLQGMLFVVYWLACFGFTGLAMLVALLDIRAVRHRVREQQRTMVERALDDIARAEGKEIPPASHTKTLSTGRDGARSPKG